jgi:hypothetical protein
MARRNWTILVISDDETRVRQFVCSRNLVQISIACALLLISVLTSLAAGFFVKDNQRMRAESAEASNRLLRAEVETIRGTIETFRSTLLDLTQRDEHYRLLAGLDPLDEDVRRAGIGGPGLETLQSNRLWRTDPELGSVTFAAAYDLNELVRRARVLTASWTEATESLAAGNERLAATPSIMPTRGRISSRFSASRIHPILSHARAHTGIDITAPRGTPILATANGRVVEVGHKGNYGQTVVIDHGYGYRTLYAHASRTMVRQGQRVVRGQKIAEVGSTGLTVGPHLHYEVLVNGRPVNPLNYVLDESMAP